MPTEETNITFREALNSAVRYWESRRLIYNGALFVVVAGAFVAGWPESARVIQVEPILVIFVLAVLANVAYCAAYIPDLALQFTTFRGSWFRGRWMLMVVGTLMACAVTYLFVSGMFGLGERN